MAGAESRAESERMSAAIDAIDADRIERRRGFDAGRRSGIAAVLNSPALEDIAFQLTLARLVIDALEHALRDSQSRVEFLEGTIEFISPRPVCKT